MRIAILTSGTPENKKGAFNATHQRIKHLILNGANIDVFIIRYYENRLIKVLRKNPYQSIRKDGSFEYDGIKYTNLWLPFTLTDYILFQKLNKIGPVFIQFAKKWVKLFAGYDLISAHSFEPAIVAQLVWKKFKVPFAVTWHGSEIHTFPTFNKAAKNILLKICHSASVVFFVSKQLRSDGLKLGMHIENTQVLYNAVDRNQFKPYKAEVRAQLKKENQINEAYNIGFIGGLVSIKNCHLLPGIFKRISENVENVKFYLIGDGKLKSFIAEKCREFALDVVFMGNREQKDMPGLINCFDLVLLPSMNEGLPLVVLECLACEVPILASKVGGIPEALSDDYMVGHGENFEERFAAAAIDILKKPVLKPAKLSPAFDWHQTAAAELAAYQKIINKPL